MSFCVEVESLLEHFHRKNVYLFSSKRMDTVDESLNTIDNETLSVEKGRNQESGIESRSGDPMNEAWQDRVLKALNTMLQTHVLQVDLLLTASDEKPRTRRKKNLWLWQHDEKMAVEGMQRTNESLTWAHID